MQPGTWLATVGTDRPRPGRLLPARDRTSRRALHGVGVPRPSSSSPPRSVGSGPASPPRSRGSRRTTTSSSLPTRRSGWRSPSTSSCWWRSSRSRRSSPCCSPPRGPAPRRPRRGPTSSGCSRTSRWPWWTRRPTSRGATTPCSASSPTASICAASISTSPPRPDPASSCGRASGISEGAPDAVDLERVPLIVGRRSLGLLVAKGAREPLSPAERRILLAFGNQLALLLERDRLMRASIAGQRAATEPAGPA